MMKTTRKQREFNVTLTYEIGCSGPFSIYDLMTYLTSRLIVFVVLALVSLAANAQVIPEGSDAEPRVEKGETQQSLCLLLESAAHANDLPTEFFVRLVWQESRFRPDAIGPITRNGKRALGIAQFMPGTATERNLLDPINPVQALPKAAEFLKELRRQFGNIGLAAAAYNAGATRIREWMDGKASIPSETRAYVFAITGATVDEWAGGAEVPPHQEREFTCDQAMALLRHTPTVYVAALEQHVIAGVMQPWGAILGAKNSRSEILARYATLQQHYSDILTGRDPILLERRRGSLPRYQVRVGAATRAEADGLCKRVHKSGGDCVVLRNPRI